MSPSAKNPLLAIALIAITLVRSVSAMDSPPDLIDLLKEGESPFALYLLQEEGADPNVADSDGLTPLLWAIRTHRPKIAICLLEREADPNTPDKQGVSPLIWAIRGKDINIIIPLLEHGANPNSADVDGWTPLLSAAHNHHTAFVMKLLEYGADPNTANVNGWTPLLWAARSNHPDITTYLLASGAQPETKDNHGLTPRQCADNRGHTKIIELLDNADAHYACSWPDQLRAQILRTPLTFPDTITPEESQKIIASLATLTKNNTTNKILTTLGRLRRQTNPHAPTDQITTLARLVGATAKVQPSP